MLPSLPKWSEPAKTPLVFVINSEDSIACAKRKRYFVVGMHREHADLRFGHAEIRCRVPAQLRCVKMLEFGDVQLREGSSIITDIRGSHSEP
jgi:site-specific DNA-cytosine methylase